ncbi:hypothetical protein [Pseudoclavibacter sp. VKM Ac-2867]|uniref:hypothetical protein n=1 Tax=Pseudoclavibacter sp. VKM Ac-2867 TaxID=2783829 RepID=UPI00188B92A5|nr:hypothetical protein [Pseudoclavibacter sp. VKM Ac-2867]MBF4460507.1 hypothetical protein [Pseudoclavibacter sp. VKM Ac-2867]
MRRRIFPIVAAAALALALTGCAADTSDATAPSASAQPTPTPTPTVEPLTDVEIYELMIPASGEVALESDAMVESITDDPSGGGIDPLKLAVLDEKLLRFEGWASPELRTALVAYHEPIHALQQIYDTGVNTTITTSVGPDATALLGACVDVYEAADVS